MTLPAPSATSLAGRAVLMLRADQMVSGLSLTYELPDGSGEFVEADPLRIVSIEPVGDRLLFVFDNRWQMHFDPAEPVAMVCAPVDHPSWCADPAKCEAGRDSDGTIYHAGPDALVDLADEDGHEATVWLRVHRCDDPDGEQGTATISLYLEGRGVHDGLDLLPDGARELAAVLAGLARDIDGRIPVEDVRLGDEIETPAGWQTVTGLMHDARCAEVAVYTTSDEDPALRLPLGTAVPTRHTPSGVPDTPDPTD